MSNQNNHIIFITGPTAVGKSDVAIKLAQLLETEIVSCDSMQVYQEISIASNKPNDAELDAVVHHLIDAASIYDEFDVNQYVRLADKAIREIIRKGRIPIVCGGTGLYMEGLIDGLFEGPPADWQLRDQWQAVADEQGNDALHKRLTDVDPASAEKLHPNDVRRVIRALEVYEQTGQPISVLQQQRKGLASEYAIKVYVLNRDRDKLYQKIDDRVITMMNDGLVDEVKRLDASRVSKTAKQLIGIKETLQYLQGQVDKDRLTEMIQQNSRNYAKRQLTWFRKDERFCWIDVDKEDALTRIQKEIHE